MSSVFSIFRKHTFHGANAVFSHHECCSAVFLDEYRAASNTPLNHLVDLHFNAAYVAYPYPNRNQKVCDASWTSLLQTHQFVLVATNKSR
jgi:hypothetical protein